MGKRTAMLPVAIGACSGLAIVATVDYRDEPLWQVWAVLGVGLTTAAGFVFVHGLRRWRDLFQTSLHLRDVAFPVAALAAVSVLSTGFSLLQEGPSAWRGPVLVSLAILGTIPSACTMYGIRQAALDHLPGAKTNGERTARLVRMDHVLRRRLLPAVGSLVALATLALAVAVKLQGSRGLGVGTGDGRQMTPEVILVFGGMGSLLVGLLYVPTAAAIRQEGESQCDLLFDLHAEDDGGRISELLEKRHRFQQSLGTDRDFLSDLQISVVVLGPIISSALSGLLPG